MHKLALVAALLPGIGLAAACRDPVGSETESTTTATEPTTTATEPTTTATEPTTAATEGTSTGDAYSREICDLYLACIAAVAPAGLPGAQMGFGESGTCWQGGEQDAELCLAACQAGVEMYLEVFPEEQACVLCHAHSECDMAAGELCHLGKCSVTTCGDGVVDAEEMCDGQPGCDPDCLGPAACNPFTDAGCEGEACILFLEYGTETVYAECLDEQTLTEGFGCEMFAPSEMCRSELVCTHPDLVPGCDADNLKVGCCARICDLGSKDCYKGETCVAYEPPPGYQLSADIAYLGVCIPP